VLYIGKVKYEIFTHKKISHHDKPFIITFTRSCNFITQELIRHVVEIMTNVQL